MLTRENTVCVILILMTPRAQLLPLQYVCLRVCSLAFTGYNLRCECTQKQLVFAQVREINLDTNRSSCIVKYSGHVGYTRDRLDKLSTVFEYDHMVAVYMLIA